MAYSLLGNCLIEKIYDSMTFEDYVNKFILQPLGMTNTGFKYTEEYVCTCVDIMYAPSIKILDM